jgi:hypothetical protein
MRGFWHSTGPLLVTVQDARDLLPEGLHFAACDRAAHPAGPDIQHNAPAVGGHVGCCPLVIAVHADGLRPAGRAGHRPSRVLARTTIISPASLMSSMTSADNPENTVPTSSATSIMTNRDRIVHTATTGSATEPLS